MQIKKPYGAYSPLVALAVIGLLSGPRLVVVALAAAQAFLLLPDEQQRKIIDSVKSGVTKSGARIKARFAKADVVPANTADDAGALPDADWTHWDYDEDTKTDGRAA